MMDWVDQVALDLKKAATADDDIFKVSSDGLAAALRKAKADERKAVADFIKRRIEDNGWDAKSASFHNYNYLAEAIERGEHMKGQE